MDTASMPPRGTADGAQPAPPSAVGSLEGWPQRRARVPWAPAGFPCRLHGTAAALVAQHPAATVPKIAAAGRADTARHRIDEARRAERKIDQHYCTIRKSAGPRIFEFVAPSSYPDPAIQPSCDAIHRVAPSTHWVSPPIRTGGWPGLALSYRFAAS